LLHEIEQIIHRQVERLTAHGIPWEDLEIIVESPLANTFSKVYKTLASCWDREAKRRVQQWRHTICFEQLLISLVSGGLYVREALKEKIYVAYTDISAERGNDFEGKLQ
jgi:hypothetical protein